MTILEALNWGEAEIKSTLSHKATKQHNAKIDAQALLSSCLNKPTSHLFSHFDDLVPETALACFQTYITRRKAHEPVAYILQEKSFYGYDFRITPDVLIPRPETERLVELAIHGATEDTLFIDVGTGSGAIAITLARETNCPVVAIDISELALAVAQENAKRLNVETRISFLHGHLLEPYIKKHIGATTGRTIITANLPYVPIANWRILDPDVRTFEPKLALVGGVDGLDVYDTLLLELRTQRHEFSEDLILLMEIDPSQELTLPRLVREHFPLAEVEVVKDLAGKPRIVAASL